MFLNIKTEYNFLNSLCKIDDLIKFASSNNIKTLGIVDDNKFISHSKFIDECKSSNIKPIIGVKKKSTILNNNFITIYAKNKAGIEYINYLDDKITNIDQIKSQNIIIVFNTLNFKNEDYEKMMSELKHFENYSYFISYDENLLFKIDELNISNQYKKIIKSKMIYDEEIRFITNDQIQAYALLNSINKSTKYLDEKKNIPNYKSLAFEFKIQKLKHINNFVLQNSQKLVEEIQLYNIHFSYNQTIDFEEFKNNNFENILFTKLKTYLNKDNLEDKAEVYKKRLTYEINTIQNMQFENYFYIMEDIIKYCIDNNILYGYGRGSAAGSLVSFLFNITKIDPIEYNIYFERFLNPKRSSLPDIDLDISDIYRQQVIDYIINKYGQNHVAKIFTINKYLVKSAFNDLVKVLDFNKEVAKKISKVLDSSISFEQNINNNYKYFSKYLTDAKFDFLKENIKYIENLPKNTSIHAAGIIISSINLNKVGYVDYHNNVIYTEAKYLEKIGFIKFDLLALSNLTFVDVLEKKVQEVDSTYNSNVPLDEQLVYKNLSLAKTLGIFQLESKGVKNLLKKYQPENLMDIAIVISLYRPGPMKNIDLYLQNKKNYPNIKYIDESLKDILAPTYGIFIFQEQIMEVVQKMASFSATQADIFRAAISKKQYDKIHVQKKLFIDQGLENGYKKEVLEKVFADIEEFADYGFNKAHAVSYARLIYQLMYLKSKYPTIFYSVLYKNNINSNQKEDFLVELYSNNIQLITPSIKYASYENKVSRGKIYIGLENVKGITKQNKLNIINKTNELKDKEKITKEDFLSEVIISQKITKEEIFKLVHSGFLDDLKINKKSLYKTLTKYSYEDLNIFKSTKEKIEIQYVDDYTIEEKINYEYDSLNINIIYSPKQMLLKKLNKVYPNEILMDLSLNLTHLQMYKDYFIIATIIKTREIKTKTNKNMAFVNIKHNSLKFELVCFDQDYENLKKDIFKEDDSMKILKVQKSKGDSLVLKNIIN